MRYYFLVIENREILWIFHKNKSPIAFMFKNNFTIIVLIVITIKKTNKIKEAVYRKTWLILINLWIRSFKGVIRVKNF